MASAGSPPPSWERLEAAATTAMDKGMPITTSGSLEQGESGTVVAAPLVVQRGPAGALVIETAARLEPMEDDLEILALFSSQAAIAIRNTLDLERLRSGAVAALGRMATQVAHEIKNPLAGLRLYVRHLEQRLARTGDADARDLAGKIATTVDHLARSPRSAGRPSFTGRRRRSIRCSTSAWSWPPPGVRPTASRSSGRSIR